MRITENKCNCSFKVMPITDYPEVSTLYNPTWEDSGVLTLIYKVNENGSAILVDINLSLHVVDCKPQREVYELSKLQDGWYKIKSYILPTRKLLEDLGMTNGYNDIEYLTHWAETDPSNMLNKDHVMTIAIDEEGICFLGRVATPFKGMYYWLRADLIDVIDEFQNRGIQNGYVYGTNVRVVEEDFFTTCHLYKCFIKKAQDLLDLYKGCSNGFSICSSIKCKSNVDLAAIQIRDYLWMILNAIKYATECGDFQTANRLLNCISTCSGICNDVVESDCGCGSYKPITTTRVAVIPADEQSPMFNYNNYYNKEQIMLLLNGKQDKLTAGIDINITEDNIINNQHKFISNEDITNLWNE